MRTRTAPASLPRGLRLAAATLACALLAGACTSSGATAAPEGAPTVEEMAAEAGRDVVRSLWRGYYPGRSGDVLLVTAPHNVMGTWGSGVRGPNDPRTSHAVPWDYLARVPIALWGPGFVREGVREDRAVTVADLAPTFAAMMGFPWEASDGRPLVEALAPAGRPPRAIVLIVHDGGGWNVLEEWAGEWPVGARLMREGTVYTNATVGSAPPVTAPVHATMGTGAFPRTHGMPEIVGRLPDGSIGEVYFDRADPSLLEVESVADAWDRDRGNRAWVGMVGFESWHLGMMGTGAGAEGGDRDVAVIWDRDEERWYANEEFYALPDDLPGREVLDAHIEELDAADGARDGAWMENDLGDPARIPGTPAYAAYVGDVVREVIEREPIGDDDVTDLLFVNLKPTDFGGHIWNYLSEEQRQALAMQDRVVGDILRQLDRRVGRGEYVVAMTADHGQTLNPSVTGGHRVDKFKVADAVNAYFGREIVETTSPDDLYLYRDRLQVAGITVEAVARFVGTISVRDVLPDGTDLEAIPEAELDAPAFAAALPGDWLGSLTPRRIEAIDPGPHPEGDLTTPPDVVPPG